MSGIQQMMLGGGASIPATPGQVEYVDFGITDWIVPERVTSICAVCIGAGGNGLQNSGNVYGGGGGGLAYKNNIAVVPGQTLRFYREESIELINITTGNIILLSATHGQSGAGAPTGGGVGSNGDANFSGGGGTGGFGGVYPGGGAGTYTANGATGAGTGTSLNGTTGGGSICGAGGTSVYSGSPSLGGFGGIRVIWGAGRSYPSNAAAV